MKANGVLAAVADQGRDQKIAKIVARQLPQLIDRDGPLRKRGLLPAELIEIHAQPVRRRRVADVLQSEILRAGDEVRDVEPRLAGSRADEAGVIEDAVAAVGGADEAGRASGRER